MLADLYPDAITRCEEKNKIYKTFVTNFDVHHIDEQFYNCQSGLFQQFACRSTCLPDWSHSDCSQRCSKASIWRISAGSCDSCSPRSSALALRTTSHPFNVALFVYKAINNLAPDYITIYCWSSSNLAPDYVTIYCRSSCTNDRRSTLRSADKAILFEPKTRTEFGKKSFSYAGPHQWNQLPLCVWHAGPHQWNQAPLCDRHMQDRISGINYHCVSDNHHLSTFLIPGLKVFVF